MEQLLVEFVAFAIIGALMWGGAIIYVKFFRRNDNSGKKEIKDIKTPTDESTKNSSPETDGIQPVSTPQKIESVQQMNKSDMALNQNDVDTISTSFSDPNPKKDEVPDPSILDSKKMAIIIKREEVLKKREEVLNKIKSEELEFTEELEYSTEIWDFIIKYQVHEAAPCILNWLNSHRGYDNRYIDFARHSTKYFLSIPKEKFKRYLYDFHPKKNNISDFLNKIIRECHLIDYDLIMKLLQSDDFDSRKIGLSLSRDDKPDYTKEDFYRIKQLIKLIKSVFPSRAKPYSKKSMFKSQTTTKWLCECGQKNKENLEYCKCCSKDQYGFRRNEIKPQEVIELLEQKEHALRLHFNLA